MSCTRSAMRHAGAHSMPSSTSGTSTKEITGIATKLTRKPASDTDENQARVKGASATPTRACVHASSRTASRRRAPCSRSPSSSTPIAVKDNQKPEESGASGSRTSTASSAAPSTSKLERSRPDNRIAHHTESITTVRCVGMPKPASSE